MAWKRSSTPRASAIEPIERRQQMGLRSQSDHFDDWPLLWTEISKEIWFTEPRAIELRRQPANISSWDLFIASICSHGFDGWLLALGASYRSRHIVPRIGVIELKQRAPRDCQLIYSDEPSAYLECARLHLAKDAAWVGQDVCAIFRNQDHPITTEMVQAAGALRQKKAFNFEFNFESLLSAPWFGDSMLLYVNGLARGWIRAVLRAPPSRLAILQQLSQTFKSIPPVEIVGS